MKYFCIALIGRSGTHLSQMICKKRIIEWSKQYNFTVKNKQYLEDFDYNYILFRICKNNPKYKIKQKISFLNYVTNEMSNIKYHHISLSNINFDITKKELNDILKIIENELVYSKIDILIKSIK